MTASSNDDVSLTNDVLVKTAGASKLLGIPAATLSKWRSTGENNIPFIKIGHQVRYSTADLREYIARHTKHGAS